tara:strand:+ start:1249 stop:2895 length:1647 start_codon:yes stop_codon:yes gene_type:complete
MNNPNNQIVECVPNFSEGKSKDIIDLISQEIINEKGVTLLDVDMGYDTNRTVITFAGNPCSVINAAYNAIKKASQLIDMKNHFGTHPRMGATDVCPLIPISNISMDECIEYSKKLAKRVGQELKIPVFLYEKSALYKNRVNLADIRKGEYEYMKRKISLEEWKPDFCPDFNEKSGVTAIGARNFLIAYNINLNTNNKKIASDIALDLREQGRAKRDAKGKILRDDNGKILKVPGKLKSVKAVGWYLEEFNQAQVSMNLTDYKITSVHNAFESVRYEADKRGVRVTGSEIVGLIPLEAIVQAGLYFNSKQIGSPSVSTSELIDLAVISLGLNDLSQFDTKKSIIEYAINNDTKLDSKSINDFLNDLSKNTATPGGGSVSALFGALSLSLLSMTINISNLRNEIDSGTKIQILKENYTDLITEDTNSFKLVMKAFSMKKKTNKDKNLRNLAIEEAYRKAVSPPLKMLLYSTDVLEFINKYKDIINPSCSSDMGVALTAIKSCITGSLLNIQINLKEINDKSFIEKINFKIKSISDRNKLILEKIGKKYSA